VITSLNLNFVYRIFSTPRGSHERLSLTNTKFNKKWWNSVAGLRRTKNNFNHLLSSHKNVSWLLSKLSLLFQRARAFPDAFCFYWAPICIHCSPPDLVIYMQILMPSLKKPNPCYLQSRLQLCLEISISLNSRNLLQFLQFSYWVTVHCKGERRKTWKKNHTLFSMVKEIHTETSCLRTLKIMPRNLNEIVWCT